ncbi:DUF2510 domain-containing protein [Georgenia sp. Z1344]|uniref:DUF2510 domain-containing protein n=1 Tax=Georgenia sp. Z1344 TaxID=3416706 RepID=UPI003CE8CFEA
MEQREPGWHPDPWQEGLERRWDGTRWTADVREPGTAGPDEYPAAGPEQYGASAAPTPAGERPASDPYGMNGPDASGAPGDGSGGYGDAFGADGAEPPPSRISDAERAVAAHEGREPGPTMAGLPFGRYDDDPQSRRTTSFLIKGLWGVTIAFGVLLVIWGVMTLF